LAADAFGVGKFGEQEHAFALVVRPKTTGSQSERKYRVIQSLKLVSESLPRPRSVAPCSAWIFSDNNARAKFVNNADELTAKALLAFFSKSNG
jgi:23S rRNA A1618 N6-methylase RlmF